MAKYVMQARASTDGSKHVWLSDSADFAGAGYDGPGSPEDVVVLDAPAAGGGGGGGSVGAWTTFTPTFGSVPQELAIGDPVISITGNAASAGLVLSIVVEAGGTTFEWGAFGAPADETGVAIPMSGSHVLGATGLTAHFPSGTYFEGQQSVWDYRNASLGDGILKGRWRQVGTDIEVETLFRKGSTTNFGTGALRFPLPPGKTFTDAGLLYGGDDIFPFKMIPVPVVVKANSPPLAGYEYMLLVDAAGNLYLKNSTVTGIPVNGQVLLRAMIPVTG